MPGPMMGGTPPGVVARRMWPSRVGLLRELTHALANARALYRAMTVIIASVWGGAQEPQSGFPGGAGG